MARAVVWADSVQLMLANPVLGSGVGIWIHGLSHSHMSFWSTADSGVPGLVLMATKLAVILAVCTATILLALRSRTANLGDRYLCIAWPSVPSLRRGQSLQHSLGPTTTLPLQPAVPGARGPEPSRAAGEGDRRRHHALNCRVLQ